MKGKQLALVRKAWRDAGMAEYGDSRACQTSTVQRTPAGELPDTYGWNGFKPTGLQGPGTGSVKIQQPATASGRPRAPQTP